MEERSNRVKLAVQFLRCQPVLNKPIIEPFATPRPKTPIFQISEPLTLLPKPEPSLTGRIHSILIIIKKIKPRLIPQKKQKIRLRPQIDKNIKPEILVLNTEGLKKEESRDLETVGHIG